jgi:hypothetical protein
VKRALVGGALLVALGLGLPGLALAQGLGDAAAREKQKRKATPKGQPVRVITNDDLSKEDPNKKAEDGSQAAQPGPAASTDTADYQAERESRQAGGATDGDSQQQALAQAQAQVDSARSAVIGAEARVKELGDKLNPMSPSYVYGQANAADATGEEIRTREALKAAEAELAGAREGLVQANKNFEDVRLRRKPSSER